MQSAKSDSGRSRRSLKELPRIKISAREAKTRTEESAPDHAFGVRSLSDVAKAVSVKRHTSDAA